MTWSCIAVKTPLFRRTNQRLSAVFSTLLFLHIIDCNHTDGGHARLFGIIVSWLCYYILHLWGVHLRLHGLIVIIIIIIIIIIISFMQCIYIYIPQTNYIPREYSVAAILLLLFMVLISLVSLLNLLYFHISTLRVMCAVPNMAVFWSSCCCCYYYYYYYY